MQPYINHPTHSISMVDSPDLREALGRIREEVQVVIETGTHQGTGSTRILAECLPQAQIQTIEASEENYQIAVKNLSKFPNVRCRLGTSVWAHEAEEFMAGDPALQNHQSIEGVYIDKVDVDGAALAAWYLAEVRGAGAVQNYLPYLIAKFAENKKLIVLDSAGGIGWLEFQVVVREMINQEFYLLLDDTHHLKHYRSVEYAAKNPEEFEVVGQGDGWWLGRCKPVKMVGAVR